MSDPDPTIPARADGTTADHGSTGAATGSPRGSLLRASTIMTLLALLLSWLPLIGPLVAGVVGGREAGTPARALGVALLPALLLGLLVGWLLAAFDLPVLGAIAGVGVAIAIIVQLAPMLLGAWFGGAMADDSGVRSAR